MPLGDAFQSFMQQRQNRYMLNRQAQLQQAQVQRLQQQEMMRMMMFMNSPALQREARLKSQFATREQDARNQDAAWVQALLRADPKTIAPELRDRLKAYREYYAANPIGAGKIIQQFLGQGKPHPPQLKANVTTDENGNPVTSYEIWDPNAGIPPGPTSGVPAGMGLSPDAKGLAGEYGLSE